MKVENSLSSRRMSKDNLYMILLATSAVLLTFVLCPFSPVYRYNFDTDSVCYEIVARGIMKGKVPYRDLFDHKGPFTYVIYLLGYLISFGSSWGSMIVYCVINACTYILAYKTVCIYKNEDISFGSVTLFMFISGFVIESVFSNSSRPDNFLLIPLLLSAYIFASEVKKQGKDTVLSNKQMFIIGLMCGVVFATKLNVCLYYFLFGSFYFLHLLISKRFADLFKNFLAFMGGIVLVCIPFAVYLGINHAFFDFIDIYIVFNAKYSAFDGYSFCLLRETISSPAKISITIFLVLTLLSFAKMLRKKEGRIQKILYLALSAVIFGALTISYVCSYFFIIFMPIFLCGTTFLSEIIHTHMRTKSDFAKIVSMILIVQVINTIMQCVIVPYTPKDKTQYERDIETFVEEHPDADYLYFLSLCLPVYNSYTDALPEVKNFYLPYGAKEDMYKSQLVAIANGDVDVVLVASSSDADREETVELSWPESHGYIEYSSMEQNGVTYFMLVRSDLVE